MTGDEAIAYAAGYGDASEDYARRGDEREVAGYAQGFADAVHGLNERLRQQYWAGYSEAREDLSGRGPGQLTGTGSTCGLVRRRPLHGRRPPGRVR